MSQVHGYLDFPARGCPTFTVPNPLADRNCSQVERFIQVSVGSSVRSNVLSRLTRATLKRIHCLQDTCRGELGSPSACVRRRVSFAWNGCTAAFGLVSWPSSSLMSDRTAYNIFRRDLGVVQKYVVTTMWHELQCLPNWDS